MGGFFFFNLFIHISHGRNSHWDNKVYRIQNTNTALHTRGPAPYTLFLLLADFQKNVPFVEETQAALQEVMRGLKFVGHNVYSPYFHPIGTWSVLR